MSQLLNPKTKQRLDHFIKKPSHGLIIHGSDDQHNKQLALEVAKSLSANNYVHVIEPLNSSVTIDQIRATRQLAKLQHDDGKLVIVINKANTMTLEAQSAALKLLEEPNANYHFILASTSLNELLPTIRSRLSSIANLGLPAAQVATLAKEAGIEPLWLQNVAQGQASVIADILQNQSARDAYQELVDKTKKFLADTHYDRLQSLQVLHKDKALTNDFLNMLSNLALSALRAKAEAGQIQEMKRWIEIIEQSQTAKASLAANASPRSVLTLLATSI